MTGRAGAEVAVLGLGAMGGPMADVLHAAGVPLRVWNRSPARSERFRDMGEVVVAATPAEAACGVVLTVLPDLDQVRQVLAGPDGLAAGWRAAGVPDPLLVVMGTVSPLGVAELAQELRPDGVRVVDAPVSGGVVGAREARLSIMVGAEHADLADVEPVLRLLGTTVRHMGPVGSGELAKACNQMIVAGTVAVVSEAMLMGRAAGLEPADLLDLLLGGLASSEILRQKGMNWVQEDFVAGGTADFQLKDLRFVHELADRLDLVLPVSGATTAVFRSMIAHDEGHLDHTGVYRTVERLSGRRPG